MPVAILNVNNVSDICANVQNLENGKDLFKIRKTTFLSQTFVFLAHISVPLLVLTTFLLKDTSWVRGCPLEKNSYARKF